MTETPAPVQPQDGGASNAKIVYILYLVSLIAGITSIIGVVMAYIYQGDASDWVRDHYRWQIRTFWIGILYSLAGFLLTFIGIGFILLLLVVVWFIIRCIKGFQCLEKRQPLPDSGSWLF
ncbi:DUF4870 family protein [Marinobacterium sediminicola]|uniref:Uncharacterized membrane protein n=1 Tax=Marinobacterium sediminicola TaxID=518898 RepID=A0ABY1S1T3_9GAMM|nr:DUF4870 domain-containing protein [Marinobacterium sediminicola]ULG69497.1 hypothetical protein LN244_01390 [Marinobacterium sediminicola]SMR75647.1 Uncharacterized membrane protein [Marinobacterium sediminicola]